MTTEHLSEMNYKFHVYQSYFAEDPYALPCCIYSSSHALTHDSKNRELHMKRDTT